MKYQDYMIDVIQNAFDEVFRYAEAVPADKADWKPLDAGRSVLDMTRELAKTPDWAVEVITSAGPPEFSEEKMAEQRKEMETWKSVAECKAEAQKRLEKLFAVYRTISDEKLKETKWLPYNGGRDHTYQEMLDYPRWNANYHLGQIGYIQTLYGDKQMY